MKRINRIIQSPLFLASIASIISFFVYLRTLAPEIMWYDMGEFTSAAIDLGIAHNTGYPLYIVLGKLFSFLPVGSLAFRVNLMSAVFGALTVGLTYLIVQRLTSHPVIPLLSASLIAFSSTLWGNSTWAEVYSLNAFLTALILYLLILDSQVVKPSYLVFAFFLFGLGLGNHRLIVGLGFAMIYFALWNLKNSSIANSKHAFKWIIVFLLGFSIHLYLPIRAAMEPDVMWADASQATVFLQMITTGMADTGAFYNPFGNFLQLRHWARILTIYPFYELTAVGLLLGFFGGWVTWKRHKKTFVATSSLMITTIVVVSIYGIHDIFNYFLPIYQVLAIWGGVGAKYLLDTINSSSRINIGGLGDKLSGSLLGRVFLISLSIIPMVLFVRGSGPLDRSTHFESVDYVDLVHSQVEEGGVVLTDFWSWTPLLYAQVIEGKRPDIRLIPAFNNEGIDIKTILQEAEASGLPAYVATRLDDDPDQAWMDPYSFNLISPFAVSALPTAAQPLPAYKDLLVPKGAIYQVGRGRGGNEVAKVPSGSSISPITIDDNLALLGFRLQPAQIAAGGIVEFDFYWQLLEKTRKNYWVDILLADDAGKINTKYGFPLWQASHYVGGGAFPTSMWLEDAIYHESYSTTISRGFKPGTYHLILVVYTDGPRENRADLIVNGESQPSVTLGLIEIRKR